MFNIVSYSKSTDDNAYYIVLDNNGNRVIVKTRSYKVRPMHKRNYIKKDISIEGDCDNQELFNFLVNEFPLFIYYVPEEYLSDEMIDSAILKEGDVLSIIDKSKRSIERCNHALEENGLVYRSIPKELRSFNLAYHAVRNNGLALRHIEEEYKCYELCLRAVFNDLRAFKWVPDTFYNRLLIDLCSLGIIDAKYVNDNSSENIIKNLL
jgi:hypothetical protein